MTVFKFSNISFCSGESMDKSMPTGPELSVSSLFLSSPPPFVFVPEDSFSVCPLSALPCGKKGNGNGESPPIFINGASSWNVWYSFSICIIFCIWESCARSV